MKRIIALILSLTTLVTLAACKKDVGPGGGKSGDTAVLTDAASSGGEGGISYMAKTLLTAESEIGLLGPISQADGGLYVSAYSLNQDSSYTYRLAFIDMEGSKSNLPSDWLQGGRVVSMTRCPDDGVWIIKSLPIEDKDAPFEYELGQLTKEGYTPLSSAEIPTGLTVMQMCAVNSKIFVSMSDFKGTNLLTAYNSDGTTEYSIDMDTENYSITSDGENMYMLTLSDDGVSERRFILYSFNPNNQKKEELFSFTQGDLLACDRDKVYICDSTTLYVYYTASDSIDQILHWASIGLGGVGNSLCLDGKGGFFVWNQNTSIKHLTPTEGGKGKQQVVLAVNSPNYPSSNVLAFNESNTEYEVIIKNYNSYPDPQTMLNTEIMAGNGPDLIDIMTFSGEMLNPNAMTDLLPLIENDPDISVDDFFEAPLRQMMTDDGRLPAIAQTFMVHTLLYKSGTVESGEYNGVIDALNKMDQPATVLDKTLTRDYFLLLAFACGDSGKYTAEEVKTILEYASALPEAEGYNGTLDESGEQQKFIYGVIGSAHHLFFPILLDTFKTMEISQLGIFGLPFREGTGTVAPSEYIAMPANANCPDGAWEYIKSMLTFNGKMRLQLDSFPLLKEAYEYTRKDTIQRAENGKLTTSVWDSGKEETVVIENADFFHLSDQLLAGVNGIYTNDQAIYNIVSDSAAPYFNGDKSLDDAANEIMSRLEIYFAEKS